MAVLANALYILLIVIGGAIVMGHQTVQSLYSAKEIAPRLVAGLVVGNASMAILALLIHLSDALATAILGQGVNPNQAGPALAKMIVGSVTSGGIFTALLACGGAAMLVAVLLTWIVRLAAMVILAAGAPWGEAFWVSARALTVGMLLFTAARLLDVQGAVRALRRRGAWGPALALSRAIEDVFGGPAGKA